MPSQIRQDSVLMPHKRLHTQRCFATHEFGRCDCNPGCRCRACSTAQVERERQAEGAKAGGLHQATRDAHAQLKRLTKDLQARLLLCRMLCRTEDSHTTVYTSFLCLAAFCSLDH